MSKVFKNSLFTISYFFVIIGIAFSIECKSQNNGIKKQTKIRLDNNNGVPFTFLDNFFYNIEGFEVDENGFFYFLSGSPKNGSLIF